MTPLWVPVLVAAAGLVGTVGAVWLTQRRADQREQTNWNRERERERQRWAREDAARTFENRRDVYSAFYESLQDTALLVYNHALGLSDEPELPAKWQFPSFQKLQDLRLYATPAVSEAAASAYTALWGWGHSLAHAEVDEDYREREERYDEAMAAVLEAIRRDLAIPDDMGPGSEPNA
jgi:hypothetical protein